MPPSRTKAKKQPKLLRPYDYNLGNRGELYRVYARPLIPARASGHPFRGKRLINITPLVENINWQSSTEESGAVTGSVTVRNPGNWLGILVAGSKIIVKQANPFIVGAGNKSFGNPQKYVTILELIVQERDKQQTELTMTLSLGDRLTYLSKSERDFNFKKRKGKKSPTASDIIRKVCKQERIPFSRESIPTTRLGLDKVSGESISILQFFHEVLKKHNKLVDKKNGKKPPPPNWDIHMRTRLLTIRPKRPPATAWYLSENYFLGEPSYKESTKDLATKVIVTGKNTIYKKKFNKGGKVSKRKKAIKNKVVRSAQNDQMIAVYGLIVHREKVSGNLTPERAQRIANAVLAKRTRMQRELSFTCPALPNIWPGSKVYLHLPSYGMKGLFTVTAIDYQVSGNEGPMMGLTVDAGAVSVVTESAPRIIPIKATRLRSGGVTLDVYWNDKHHLVYTHPKRYRIAKVQIERSKDVPEHLRPERGETVLIRFKNGTKVRIRNRVLYPKGLVAVTDEGYVQAGS